MSNPHHQSKTCNHLHPKVAIKVAALCVLCGSGASAYADLPLTVDELTTYENKFRLEAGLTYVNQTGDTFSQPSFTTVDLGSGRTLNLANPTIAGKTNSDTLIATLGLRYGVNDRLEVGIKTSGVTSSDRTQLAGASKSTSDTRLQDAWLTSQYQLTKNHDSLPDTLVFGEVSVYDDTPSLKKDYGTAALVGLTAYTVNDPIVLSGTASYQYHADRHFEQGAGMAGGRSTLAVGDVFGLSGTLGFAVNPDITLNTGMSWQYKQADELKEAGFSDINKTKTQASLGFAYAVSERSNVLVSLQTDVSGDTGSTLGVRLSSKLGALPPPLSEQYKQVKRKTDQAQVIN